MTYAITDTITGNQSTFEDWELDCVKHAFGFDADSDTSEACDKLVNALRRRESTYGIEQFLGIEVEEV